jgi:hypothetical protein
MVGGAGGEPGVVGLEMVPVEGWGGFRVGG